MQIVFSLAEKALLSANFFEQIDIWPIICVVIGLGFIIIEAFIPGFGIFGIFGVCSLIIATFMLATSFWQGLLIITVLLSVAAIFFIIIIRSISRGRLGKTAIVLKESATDVSAPVYKDLIGKIGVATTTLRPAGKAEIEDNTYDVVSSGALI